MDISSLGTAAASMDALNSFQLPEFLKTLTSPKLLSSISLEQVLWIGGGLMLFRLFGGIIFSLIGLLSMILSTITSVVCSFISIFVRTIGSTVISVMNLLGTTARVVFNSPLQMMSAILSRWGRFFIPVVASGLMSSFYIYQNPFSDWFLGPEKKAWVAIEDSSRAELFERF